jgi:hypothetical protein
MSHLHLEERPQLKSVLAYVAILVQQPYKEYYEKATPAVEFSA